MSYLYTKCVTGVRLQRDRRLPLAPGMRQCVPVRAGVARAQNVAVRPSRCSCTVDCLLLLTGAREIHADHACSCQVSGHAIFRVCFNCAAYIEFHFA